MVCVCVVCSCCATSPYREVCRAKGGIGSGETLCHDIYPGSNLAVCVNRAIDDWPAHTAGGHLLSVVQAATDTERL